MLKAFVLISVLLLQASFINCGHVYSWDIDFEYQNAGHAHRFNLYFSLESGLPAEDYINVKFPFILGNSGYSSAPRGTLSRVQDSVQIGQTVLAVGPNDNMYYFCSFGVALLPGVWYKLSVSAQSLNTIGFQADGRQPVIEFRTASGIFSNNIVYDLNPNFGTFSLAPSPPVSLRLQILFASNNNDKFYLENVYIAYIDVTPTVFVREGAIFDILITNSDYSFSGTCENGEVVCASGAAGCEAIPRLDSSSCSVDPLNSRKIRFTYEGDVQVGKKFRINLNVKNPSRLSVPSDIIVLSVSKRSNLIYEKGYLEESLRCGQVILAQPVIKYLWGVTQKTLEPCPIGLYVPLGNDYPFNNIRIFFRFNVNI